MWTDKWFKAVNSLSLFCTCSTSISEWHISSLQHDEHNHRSYLAVKFPRGLSNALLCVKLPSCPCVVINIKANALTCFPEQLSVYIEVCISPGTRSLKILHTWMTTGIQQQGFFHRPAHENPCPFIFMNSGQQEQCSRKFNSFL